MASTKSIETVTIDGKHYDLAKLSDAARSQLRNLRFVDSQIQTLQNRHALAETARAAYGKVLADNLPSKKAPANKKKDVITVDGKKFRLEDFSETGKAQLFNLQFVEQEMERLKNEQVVARTARLQYANALANELKGVKSLKTQ